MSPRVTQRHLAQLAQVSHTTVSLALRRHPSIPAATRQRILDLARRHGYRPDPALAALNAYRIDRTAPRFHGAIAWLTCFARREGWREMIQAEGYFLGAKAQAEQHGYQLEEVWATEPGLSEKRLTQILLARGVQGLIVAPLPEPHGRLALGWKHFSAVALGHSLAEPQLHVVMNHQFRNMKALVLHLHDLGYRRIGFALPAEKDERVDHSYLGGYLVGQATLPPKAPRLRPLLAEPFDAASFRRWFRTQQPDATIVSASDAPDVIDWLRADGRRVPDDVGVAVASIPFRNRLVSGIDENVPRVGAMAVDTVIGMIHRNETGLPTNPWRILAEGTWFQGTTVRPARAVVGAG